MTMLENDLVDVCVNVQLAEQTFTFHGYPGMTFSCLAKEVEKLDYNDDSLHITEISVLH